MDFHGTYTALVTPFRAGRVDIDAFKALLRVQKEGGVDGVVPCGCTGEAATLSREERRQLLDAALAETGDSLQVIAGTGTNATDSTIELTREAEKAGAHAAMLITPYYNKPTQEGLLHHYRQVGDATKLPLVLYNVPSRTGVRLQPETVAALHATGRYAAVKEAGGTVEAVADMRSLCAITVFSGDDSLTVPMMALGARGVVSVVSNLAPRAVSDMVTAALEGDFVRARDLHFQLLPLMRAAFIETNPSPMKAMLSLKGIIENELRPPLVPVRSESMARIREAMKNSDIVGGGVSHAQG